MSPLERHWLIQPNSKYKHFSVFFSLFFYYITRALSCTKIIYIFSQNILFCCCCCCCFLKFIYFFFLVFHNFIHTCAHTLWKIVYLRFFLFYFLVTRFCVFLFFVIFFQHIPSVFYICCALCNRRSIQICQAILCKTNDVLFVRLVERCAFNLKKILKRKYINNIECNDRIA